MTADEAAQLSAFVRQEYVDVTPESALHPFYPSLAPGAGSFLAAALVAGTHTIEDAMAGVHPPPIRLDATVSVESNVPIDYDVISRGTDVFAADGHRVGTVAEVLIDPDGNVTGFVVKERVLFKHDVFIPVEGIADIGDKHIRLKVTAEQAEARPRRAGGARVTPATASGS
jgi:sporulation protein YlmC with PRC-barrel domain